MKILVLVVLCSSLAYADQAVDAFCTGFASALERRLYAQKQEQVTTPSPTVANYNPVGHYDVRDNYGRLGQLSFPTYRQCVQFLDNSQTYRQCIWINE